MRQAIATILGTTLVAWGLAATPGFAETTVGTYGACENIDSRIERSTACAALDAGQPQRAEGADETGHGTAAAEQAVTVPASDHLLALLHRLNRVDGSPMAPFRLN